jgi:hypothetical protein
MESSTENFLKSFRGRRGGVGGQGRPPLDATRVSQTKGHGPKARLIQGGATSRGKASSKAMRV